MQPTREDIPLRASQVEACASLDLGYSFGDPTHEDSEEMPCTHPMHRYIRAPKHRERLYIISVALAVFHRGTQAKFPKDSSILVFNFDDLGPTRPAWEATRLCTGLQLTSSEHPPSAIPFQMGALRSQSPYIHHWITPRGLVKSSLRKRQLIGPKRQCCLDLGGVCSPYAVFIQHLQVHGLLGFSNLD